MKAVGIHAYGDVDQLVDLEVADPTPGEKEVRVRVKATGFNPVDWRMRQGRWRGGFPAILGADCSGVIDQVGPNVSGLKEGDEVYGMPLFQCSNGSYAQYVCFPEELVAKKPKNLSHEEAAAIPLAAMTALRAVRGVQKGEPLFIAGAAGGLGTFAVQFARMAQPSGIITVAHDETSKQFMVDEQGLNPDHIVLYKGLDQSALVDKLIQINDGWLFNTAIDLVGSAMTHLCLELVSYSGHLVTILPAAEILTSLWGKTLCFSQVFVGAELHAPRQYWSVYRRSLNYITQLIETGELKPINVQNYGPLSAKTAQKAHMQLESARTKGKLVATVE